MTPDLASLVDPAHTALVTSECQNGVIGEGAALPELAAAARAEMIPNVAALARAARVVGVSVLHCVAERREDGRGSNSNARLFAAMRKSPVTLSPGSVAVQVVPEIGVEDGDIVSSRLHGVSPMSGTGLDPVLRNMGVTTIVGVGVSANVAIPNLAFDAVNLGYQFVLPRDAIAGVPQDYVDEMIANTLSLIATITTTRALLEAWAV